MGIIIDCTIIGVIVLTTFIGYKRGLIKFIFSLLSFVLALILTLLLYKPLARQIIEVTTIDDKIEDSITEKLESSDSEESDDSFEEMIEKIVKDSKNKSSEYVANSATEVIIEGISFILLFIVLRILLLLLSLAFRFIATLPIIAQFDKSGGLLYGLILGIAITYLVFAILYLTVPLIENEEIISYINQSYIGNFFYNHNLIINEIIK